MKILYIFVEGDDDEIFLKFFFKKYLTHFEKVYFWKYAQKKKTDNVKFLKSIKQVSEWDYFIFADFDSKNSLKERRREVQHKFENELDDDKILIVLRELCKRQHPLRS